MSRKPKLQSAVRHNAEPTARNVRFPMALERLADPTASAAPVHMPHRLLRPQRPLREAAQDGQRREPSSGLGLDSTVVRARMVERLRAQGQHCEPVLQAMQQVPRHRFVDSALANQAYEDTSLPIGHGQTISKPSVVARMIELLLSGANAARTQGLGRTLEIGTGCGYQAAVLCLLAAQVVSVERLRTLFDRARAQLHDLRADRLRLVHGDGMLGHAPNAPYDSIIAAACGDAVPRAWLDQLAVGGRLVAPVAAAHGTAQSLMVIDRHAQGYSRQEHDGVLFVPLKSGLE